MATTYHCPSHIRDMLASQAQRKLAVRLAQAWRKSLQPILKDGDEVVMPDGLGNLSTANKYPRRPRCVSGANRPR